MSIRSQAGRWAFEAIELDVPALFAAPPTLTTTSTTVRRSWLGLAGAVTVAARAGRLPLVTASAALDRIAAFQQPNGVMGTDGGPNNHFLLPELAQGILWLSGDLPAEKVTAWTEDLVKGATVMRDGIPGTAGRESTWWTNGNIEILEALVYYLTWKVTRDDAWQAAYDKQIAFIYAPPQTGSTVGQGVVTTKAPADPDGDWADARIYITENSGYDPDYTQYQATVLGRLFEWSQDVRVLRLLNGVLGTMLATLNPVTMRYDGVGTRRTYPNGIILHTPAIPMLAWSGLRPDLAPTAEASWLKVLRAEFPPDPLGFGEWFLRAYSDIVAGWARVCSDT